MKKSHRISTAKDSLSILKRGYYVLSSGEKVSIAKAQKEAEQKTILYKPNTLSEMLKEEVAETGGVNTVFEVNGLSSLDSVRKEYKEDEKLLCLNFASARNPRGGFLNGSQAQEESIVRASGLYPCQLQTKEYYDNNREFASCLYTDHIIYSPQVPVFKYEHGELMEKPVFASFITAPAGIPG